MVDRLADIVKSATQPAVAEIKSASTVLMESSTQMAATATSYWDALKSKGPVSNPIGVATTLHARVRVREGAKSHQILVNAQTWGECILQGVSMSGLVESANAVLRDMEDVVNHCFVSTCWLGNGSVLLEMASKAMVSW